MRTVTAGFKTSAKADVKDLYATISDGIETITQSGDLKGIKIMAEGGLCRTVMKQAEIRVWGTYAWLDKEVNIKIGVDVSGTPEYVDYGDFIVTEVKEDVATGERVLKLYDKMYQGLQAYDSDVFTYPMTILELLQAICTELGWTLGTTTFTHSTLSIASELFDNQNLTYRNILEDIAEATASIIYFDEDDELVLRSVDTSASLETILTNDVKSLTLEPKWGELNSVALAREPQNDIIVQKDDASITANGLWEFKITNNLILDGDRETYIGDIFTALNGIEYYAFESETVGLGYFEVGDVITVTDLSDDTYTVLITEISLDLSGGLSETIKGLTPDKTSTDYNTAGIIGQRITNTEIIVNKQEGEIALLNSEMETVATIPRQATPPVSPEENDLWLNTENNAIYIYISGEWQGTAVNYEEIENYYTVEEVNTELNVRADQIGLSVEAIQGQVTTLEDTTADNIVNIDSLETQLTSLELDVDGLEIEVSGLGGTNLLRNSVGLKNTLEEWQEFDENGDLVDTDNDGTIIQTSDVEENSESGSAIKIEGQFITQTVSTIEGMTYTFYCRFKRNVTTNVEIGGYDAEAVTEEGYTDEDWGVFSKEFVALGASTEITITNVGALAGEYCTLSDMVCKLGTVNGWVQAPNEVYGKNYKFDEEGFEVTSLTDDFKAVLDNVKLGIYDTSSATDKIMALFSKDAGLITKLVAQDEFTIQRYENPTGQVRFIPTSTGCMVTVND